MSAPPAVATDAVLALQERRPNAVFVRGHDFNEGTERLLEVHDDGVQGTNLGKAVEESIACASGG